MIDLVACSLDVQDSVEVTDDANLYSWQCLWEPSVDMGPVVDGGLARGIYT